MTFTYTSAEWAEIQRKRADAARRITERAAWLATSTTDLRSDR